MKTSLANFRIPWELIRKKVPNSYILAKIDEYNTVEYNPDGKDVKVYINDEEYITLNIEEIVS